MSKLHSEDRHKKIIFKIVKTPNESPITEFAILRHFLK